MGKLCICDHYNTQHSLAVERCLAYGCNCHKFREYIPYEDSLTQVTERLRKRFGRSPDVNEVYRFVWGDKDSRDSIWANKGLI